MPSLQQLRYLVAIADTLNFSRAAELCHVAQPTLSQQIRALEARLGSTLVERTRARVLLTRTGQETVRRAREILAQIEDIRQISRGHDPLAPPAVLRLGVVQTTGAYALSVGIPAVRALYPEMRIQVREDDGASLLRQVAEGTQDVILVPEPVQRAGLVCETVLIEPLLVVLPSEHPLAALTSIAPADLRGETVLAMDRGRDLHEQIARLCAAAGAEMATDYEGTTLDTLRQMVAVGMGLSLLPALYVRSEVIREERVVARPLRAMVPVRGISLIWRQASARAPVYAALAECLKEALAPWSGAAE